ncbi:MAG: phage regulatory CII family protein [Desulfovibrio sp.]
MAKEYDLLSEVLHDDVLDAPSGRSSKEIASSVGKPYVTLMNELKGQPGAKLGADLVLPLMGLSGSVRGMHFLADRLGGVFIPTPHVPKGLEPLARQAIQSVKEVGDVMRVFLETTVDGNFSQQDRRDVHKEIYDSIAALIAFDKALGL